MTALKKSVPKATGALYDNAKLFGGRVRITAFGRFYDSAAEEDWTFSKLHRLGDGQTDSSLSRHLPQIAKELKINEILAPSPVEFNARICFQKDLSVHIPVGNRLIVQRGINADGCRLDPGQAYGVSSAGCPTIVAWYPTDPKLGEKIKVDAAHAGLRSLIDEQAALTGLPSRKPESIVESMLRDMKCSGLRVSRRKRVGVVVVLPISQREYLHPWNHPQYGEKNKKLCGYIEDSGSKSCLSEQREEGGIDLGELATCQFVNLGVPLENISIVREEDVVGPDSAEQGLWYTTRRKFPGRRNLTLITRTRMI